MGGEGGRRAGRVGEGAYIRRGAYIRDVNWVSDFGGIFSGGGVEDLYTGGRINRILRYLGNIRKVIV